MPIFPAYLPHPHTIIVDAFVLALPLPVPAVILSAAKDPETLNYPPPSGPFQPESQPVVAFFEPPKGPAAQLEKSPFHQTRPPERSIRLRDPQ
jgi:hypothetical protein